MRGDSGNTDSIVVRVNQRFPSYQSLVTSYQSPTSSHIRHFSGLHKTELLTSLLFKLSVILEILTLL